MYGHTNPEYHVTEDGDRLGPRMRYAVKLMDTVGALPSKKQLAEKVGPNGSLDYGYRVVDRCLSAGLMSVESGHSEASPHGIGAVVITEKGKRVAGELKD